VPTRAERDHLDGHIGQLGGVHQGGDLGAHHGAATDRAAQHGLVEHRPHVRCARAGEQLLAGHAHVDAALDLVEPGGAVADHHDGPRVLPALQQAGDELHLVRPDHRRAGLEPQICLEPVGQHVAEALPPPLRVGLPGQGQEGFALGLVIHPVQRE
jgi:hypothetical protein